MPFSCIGSTPLKIMPETGLKSNLQKCFYEMSPFEDNTVY